MSGISAIYKKDNDELHDIHFPFQLGDLKGQVPSVKIQILSILMKIKT